MGLIQMSDNSPLHRLREKHPWPANRPTVLPTTWNDDGGGREMLTDLIVERNVSIILEIGVFFGGSARTWLNASPNVTVIGVDPWQGSPWWSLYAKQKRRFNLVEQLELEEGPYETFLASNWDFRDRMIAVRGTSPGAVQDIFAIGVVPDLIYLDSDKTGLEIEICHRLFPNAIISGEDWWWGTDRWRDPDDGYPIRKPVREFCRQHNFYLKTKSHTWLIDDRPSSLSYLLQRPLYHFKGARRRVRSFVRGALGAAKRSPSF